MQKYNNRLNFRYTKELRRKLAASAKAHERSINGEITRRLELSFETEEIAELIDVAVEKALDKRLSSGMQMGGFNYPIRWSPLTSPTKWSTDR